MSHRVYKNNAYRLLFRDDETNEKMFFRRIITKCYNILLQYITIYCIYYARMRGTNESFDIMRNEKRGLDARHYNILKIKNN